MNKNQWVNEQMAQYDELQARLRTAVDAMSKATGLSLWTCHNALIDLLAKHGEAANWHAWR